MTPKLTKIGLLNRMISIQEDTCEMKHKDSSAANLVLALQYEHDEFKKLLNFIVDNLIEGEIIND